jgi:AcrR family transcriptional regulator
VTGVMASDRPRPGRQRSEAADHAILSATLDLLSETGYGALTVAAVIARSGVSSATLYRRWPTKQDLVAAALASLHAEVVDIDTGSLATDIAAMVRSTAQAMTVKREDIAQDIAIELRRNPEFRAAINEKFIQPRRALMAGIIERAVARGELGDGLGVDVATAFVTGPLHHWVYVQGRTPDVRMQRTVVTGALAALSAIAPA